MIEEKSQRASSLAESQLKTTSSVEELQTVIHEFLALLSELNHPQAIPPITNYLSLIASLLHIMTDLETQLSIARTTLERERLIHNDLLMMSKDMVGDEK